MSREMENKKDDSCVIQKSSFIGSLTMPSFKCSMETVHFINFYIDFYIYSSW